MKAIYLTSKFESFFLGKNLDFAEIRIEKKDPSDLKELIDKWNRIEDAFYVSTLQYGQKYCAEEIFGYRFPISVLTDPVGDRREFKKIRLKSGDEMWIVEANLEGYGNIIDTGASYRAEYVKEFNIYRILVHTKRGKQNI